MRMEKPWVKGIVEALTASRLLQESRLEYRSRCVVMLLDSAFETACRAYLRHKVKINLTDDHKRRDNLMSLIEKKLDGVDPEVWDFINGFYSEIRNDFYHQSASKIITDNSVEDYREAIYFVVGKAFGIDVVKDVEECYQMALEPKEIQPDAAPAVDWKKLSGKTDRVLAAVSSIQPQGANETNDFFKRQGVSLRISQKDFTTILARNSRSKNYFFFNKTNKRWNLSETGKKQLESVMGG